MHHVTASSSASAAVCVHDPSATENGAASRAGPPVLEMLLLHVPNETAFVEHVTAATPLAIKPWSIIDSVNGLQMGWDVLAENYSIARQAIRDPSAMVRLQSQANSDQLARFLENKVTVSAFLEGTKGRRVHHHRMTC